MILVVRKRTPAARAGFVNKWAWFCRVGVALWLLGLSLPPTIHGAYVTDAPPPEALVAQMREAFARLNDYTCRLVERSFKRPDEFSESDYAFKKPRLMKLVGRAGRSQGAVVVLGRDGKPRLRKNGFPVPAFLARAELHDFTHSDFGSLIDEIARLMADGAEASVVVQGDAYVLRLARGRNVRLYSVDAKLGLPIELVEIEDGVRVGLTEWRDLRLNVGLTEDMFRP
ncbi:MAG: hypothetical protein NZ585_13010 [Chloracidobacterium sp.]|nr:hypothetical protein [Chloracidobacterium sp.]MDW8217792.1 hypothetical protein [Acidobacteriota bacterium]